MDDLITKITAEPFAGAFIYLRNLDPLYQAEVGADKEWSVRIVTVTASSHWCDCEFCDLGDDVRETKVVKVIAETVLEALDLAEAMAGRDGELKGIRPQGSDAAFVDPEDIEGWNP